MELDSLVCYLKNFTSFNRYFKDFDCSISTKCSDYHGFKLGCFDYFDFRDFSFGCFEITGFHFLNDFHFVFGLLNGNMHYYFH